MGRPHAPLEFRFPPDAAHVAEVRRKVREAIVGNGLSTECVEAVVLVVDEVVSNSIEHGVPYRGVDDELLLRVAPGQGEVRLEFEDHGVPEATVVELQGAFDGVGDLPPVESERGRGLFLIAMLVQGLRIERADPSGMRLIGRVVDGGTGG